MARRMAFILFCLAGLLVPAAHALTGLELLVPGAPSPTDVVKLIDSLTRKESSTTIDVKVGNTVSQGKLLIARARVAVTMDRTSRNWRGPVHVHVTVPTEVSFSIDLTDIRPEHIRCDPKKGLLIVAMPAPRVEDVTPVLPEIRTENSYKRVRFRFYDANTARDLQNTMFKEDFQARARQLALEQLPAIRERGRTALEAFLQQMLRRTCPAIKVVVE
jgi:hypothetical protein